MQTQELRIKGFYASNDGRAFKEKYEIELKSKQAELDYVQAKRDKETTLKSHYKHLLLIMMCKVFILKHRLRSDIIALVVGKTFIYFCKMACRTKQNWRRCM